jgi:hypothetical protein
MFESSVVPQSSVPSSQTVLGFRDADNKDNTIRRNVDNIYEASKQNMTDDLNLHKHNCKNPESRILVRFMFLIYVQTYVVFIK